MLVLFQIYKPFTSITVIKLICNNSGECKVIFEFHHIVVIQISIFMDPSYWHCPYAYNRNKLYKTVRRKQSSLLIMTFLKKKHRLWEQRAITSLRCWLTISIKVTNLYILCCWTFFLIFVLSIYSCMFRKKEKRKKKINYSYKYSLKQNRQRSSFKGNYFYNYKECQ